MRYVAEIRRFVELLLLSERFHALVIIGAPGWAKTHTTRTILAEKGVPYRLLGSYSTPLALFNALAEAPDKLVVLDDTAGVFNNTQALSILNAACWPGADSGGSRRVIWTSTTEKAVLDGFDFRSKLIVLTNHMPQTPPAQAFINRALNYQIEITCDLVGDLLAEAAASTVHFADTRRAQDVAAFLAEQARLHDPGKISLRTLELGYEFATLDPKGWRDLLVKALPKPVPSRRAPEQLVVELAGSAMKVEEQASRFCQVTGKSRRSFFYIRDRLGLTGKISPMRGQAHHQ
jgi:hypothetical protein